MVGNISSIQHFDHTGTLVEKFTVAYDSLNQMTSRHELNGTMSTYTYDKRSRLTVENTTGLNTHVYSYSYDAVDNLLTNWESGSLVSSTYDAANRLVTSLNGAALTTFTFDANGNQIVVQDGASSFTTMSYDNENRLSVHKGSDGTVATYSYDGDGLKRVELVSGVRKTLIWDGADYLQERS